MMYFPGAERTPPCSCFLKRKDPAGQDGALFALCAAFPFLLALTGLLPHPTLLAAGLGLTFAALGLAAWYIRTNSSAAAWGTEKSGRGFRLWAVFRTSRAGWRRLDDTGRTVWLFALCSALAISGGGLPEALLAGGMCLVFFPARRFATAGRRGALWAGGLLGALALGERAFPAWFPLYSGFPGRAGGLFGNPNLLAAFLCPLLPAALGELFASPRLRTAVQAGGIAVGLLCTFCRGAYLGAAAGCALTVLRCAASPLPWLLAGACGGLFLPASVLERGASALRLDTSAAYRLSLWRGVGMLPFPLLVLGGGVGRDAFAGMKAFFPAGVEAAEHLHEWYLGLLVTRGILGLALFAVLVFSLFRQGARAWSGGLLALLCLGLTEDLFYDRRIYLWFFFLAGLLAGEGEKGAKRNEKKNGGSSAGGPAAGTGVRRWLRPEGAGNGAALYGMLPGSAGGNGGGGAGGRNGRGRRRQGQCGQGGGPAGQPQPAGDGDGDGSCRDGKAGAGGFVSDL